MKLGEFVKTKYGLAKVTTTGYRYNSPDVNNPVNLIPSNKISMKEVRFRVLGIDSEGNVILMEPEQEYNFKGSWVIEIKSFA